MSIASNILQNKWRATALFHAQSALRVFLLALIIICLSVAWWRYHHTVVATVRLQTSIVEVATEEGFVPALQPLGHFVDLVQQRDIFRLTFDKAMPVADDYQLLSSMGPDVLQSYILQGTVQDKKPMAILKDQRDNKTYFLQHGDMLDDIKVIDIQVQRVVFDRGGVKMELIKK